jgi:hypothetical protein
MSIIDRRSALKGITLGTGAAILNPMLARLAAESEGKSAPKRFVFVVEGNGLPWQQIQPKGIARDGKKISSGGYTGRNGGDPREGLIEKPLTGLELAESLEPVSFVKDRVTILQGLSGKMNGGGHSNDFGCLGAYNAKGGVGNSGNPQGETIDYAVGKKVSAVFPQVSLGISERVEDTVIYNCSASARGKTLPTQCRPELAMQALFGSVAGGDARQRFDTSKNLLDYMIEDVKRLESSIAGPEREKLHSYFEAFAGMRERHEKLVQLEAQLRKNSPPVTNKFTSTVETDRLDAQFDIAAASLISGLTNSVTLASGVGNPYFGIKFTGLGINFGKHGIGHGGSFNGMTWDVMAVKIRRFHFELIARLIKKLQAVSEGNGTMFDNTCIVYLSDAAEGHHSRCWEWPAVMVGNLSGALKTGRYLEFPGHGAKNHKHIGNLYTTLLHAAGDRRDSFGQPDPILGKDIDQRGPIAELLV